MLQPGDHVPHFTAATVDGGRVSYGEIWQRRHLVLVVLPDRSAPGIEEGLPRRLQALAGDDVAVVVTADAIAGVGRFGALVADQWGEVVFAAGGETAAGLPSPEELAEWVRYVRIKCPECEGEAR